MVQENGFEKPKFCGVMADKANEIWVILGVAKKGSKKREELCFHFGFLNGANNNENTRWTDQKVEECESAKLTYAITIHYTCKTPISRSCWNIFYGTIQGIEECSFCKMGVLLRLSYGAKSWVLCYAEYPTKRRLLSRVHCNSFCVLSGPNTENLSPVWISFMCKMLSRQPMEVVSCATCSQAIRFQPA